MARKHKAVETVRVHVALRKDTEKAVRMIAMKERREFSAQIDYMLTQQLHYEGIRTDAPK